MKKTILNFWNIISKWTVSWPALIRPALDYEESETTFAAFLTREAAESARQEIISFWKNLKDLIGETPQQETDEEWVAYEKWDDQRREMLNNSQWPYNSKETYLFYLLYSSGFNSPEESIQISEIPLF